MSNERTIRVAVLQPALRWLAPMPNMHLIRQTLEALCAPGQVDLVVLPEAFNGQPADYDDGSAGRAARRFLATLARACGVHVIGGSIEYTHDDGKRRNSCWVVAPDGTELGAYHKRIMFSREQDVRTPGDEPGVFDIDGLRVGVLICADLWWPELARELAGRVDLLCVPAKTTVPSEHYVSYGRTLWWNLALTRAMENGLPVLVSDWAETRQESRRLVDGTTVRDVHYTCGASSIVDPSGRPEIARIQKSLPKGEPETLSAAINLDAVAGYRDYRRAVGLLPQS